jgi:hypothetical protein
MKIEELYFKRHLPSHPLKIVTTDRVSIQDVNLRRRYYTCLRAEVNEFIFCYLPVLPLKKLSHASLMQLMNGAVKYLQ